MLSVWVRCRSAGSVMIVIPSRDCTRIVLLALVLADELGKQRSPSAAFSSGEACGRSSR